MNCKYLPPVCSPSFYSLDGIFGHISKFTLMLFFRLCDFCIILNIKILSYIFFYKFYSFNLTFRYLVHCEFIFICGMRQESNFIFSMWLASCQNDIYWNSSSFPNSFAMPPLSHSKLSFKEGLFLSSLLVPSVVYLS